MALKYDFTLISRTPAPADCTFSQTSVDSGTFTQELQNLDSSRDMLKAQLCGAWVLIEVHAPVGGSVQMTPGRMIAELAASVLPHHNFGNRRDRLPPPRSLVPSLSPTSPPSPLLLACVLASGIPQQKNGDEIMLSHASPSVLSLCEPILMGPPPPALGAALAAAATPEPTAPITESGAYLPMTSGGWILSNMETCNPTN